MSALHRIEFVKIEDDSATIKIFAVHPDAARFPSSKDYLLQILVEYWNDLRPGYDFNFSNLDLPEDEMKRAAENFVKKDEFEKWFVLMRGEEKEITADQFDALNFREVRHDPPKEDWERVEKNKKELGERLGGVIASIFKRRDDAEMPMFYGVRLYPDPQKFIELADAVIVARSIGKSRELKSFSRATQSYGHAEIAFRVSAAEYLSHLRRGSSLEVANVAFQR